MHKNAVASEDLMRLESTATICFVPILQLQVCLHLSWKDNATAWAALGLKPCSPCSPCFFFAHEAPKVQVKQGSQMVSHGISTAELWLHGAVMDQRGHFGHDHVFMTSCAYYLGYIS